MKKITKLVATASIISASVFTANIYANNSVQDDLRNICEIVKSNDKSLLRKKMRKVQSNHNLRISDYYDAITCGDNSLIRVAFENNAEDTGTLLIKKLSKKVLKAPEKDGVKILDWAKSKANSNSNLIATLEKRLN